MSGARHIVDARGLLCPWPVVRLARAARESAGPACIQLLADDPAAPGELAQLCRERGWSFIPDPAQPDAFNIVIG